MTLIKHIPHLFPSPIEYTKILASRFLEEGYSAKEVPFSFNGDYIQDDFKKIFDYEKEDTTIINVGVGHGKTTLAYDLIGYYLNKNYVIIVASPYKNLVQRDLKELKIKYPDKTFVDYSMIAESLKDDFFEENLSLLLTAQIHIITIHSLS